MAGFRRKQTSAWVFWQVQYDQHDWMQSFVAHVACPSESATKAGPGFVTRMRNYAAARPACAFGIRAAGCRGRAQPSPVGLRRARVLGHKAPHNII